MKLKAADIRKEVQKEQCKKKQTWVFFLSPNFFSFILFYILQVQLNQLLVPLYYYFLFT